MGYMEGDPDAPELVDLHFLNFYLRREIWYIGRMVDFLIYLAFLIVFTCFVNIILPGLTGWQNTNSLYRRTVDGYANMGPEPRSPDLYSFVHFLDIDDESEMWQWARGSEGLLSLLSEDANVEYNNFIVGGIVRFTQLRMPPQECGWDHYLHTYVDSNGQVQNVTPTCFGEWEPDDQSQRNRSSTRLSPCTAEHYRTFGVTSNMTDDELQAQIDGDDYWQADNTGWVWSDTADEVFLEDNYAPSDVLLRGRFTTYSLNKGYHWNVFIQNTGDFSALFKCQEENGWIDAATRLVAIQFITINPTVQLMTYNVLFVEVTSSGGFYPGVQQTAVRFFGQDDATPRTVLFPIIFGFVIYLTFRALMVLLPHPYHLWGPSSAKQVPLEFFRWSTIFRWAHVVVMWIWLAMQQSVWLVGETIMPTDSRRIPLKLQELIEGLVTYARPVTNMLLNQDLFYKMADYANLSYEASLPLSVAVVMSYLHLLVFLNLSQHLDILTVTLKRAQFALCLLVISIGIVINAYALAACVLFGGRLHFATYAASLNSMATAVVDPTLNMFCDNETCSQMMLPFLFYWSYFVCMWIVLLNCLIAIINQAYEVAKQRQQQIILHEPGEFSNSGWPHWMQTLYQRYRFTYKSGHRPEFLAIGGSWMFHILHITHGHTGVATEEDLVSILSDEKYRWRIKHPDRVAARIMQLCGQGRSSTSSRYYQYKVERRPHLAPTGQANGHQTGRGVTPHGSEGNSLPVPLRDKVLRTLQDTQDLLRDLQQAPACHGYPDLHSVVQSSWRDEGGWGPAVPSPAFVPWGSQLPIANSTGITPSVSTTPTHSTWEREGYPHYPGHEGYPHYPTPHTPSNNR